MVVYGDGKERKQNHLSAVIQQYDRDSDLFHNVGFNLREIV
jgi:hypothetical protein